MHAPHFNPTRVLDGIVQRSVDDRTGMVLEADQLTTIVRAIRTSEDPQGVFADLIRRFAANELALGPGVGITIPLLRGAAQQIGGDRMRIALEQSIEVPPAYHTAEMEKLRADYGRPDWIGKREFYINAKWRESASKILDYLFTHVVFGRTLGTSDVAKLAGYIASASHLDRAITLPANECSGIYRPGVALLQEFLERKNNSEIFLEPGTDVLPLMKLIDDLGSTGLAERRGEFLP